MVHLRIFSLHNWNIHVVKHTIIWRKKLEEYDEIPNYSCFVKQYGQMSSLGVCVFHK
jgi:hypothetical protein